MLFDFFLTHTVGAAHINADRGEPRADVVADLAVSAFKGDGRVAFQQNLERRILGPVMAAGTIRAAVQGGLQVNHICIGGAGADKLGVVAHHQAVAFRAAECILFCQANPQQAALQAGICVHLYIQLAFRFRQPEIGGGSAQPQHRRVVTAGFAHYDAHIAGEKLAIACAATAPLPAGDF